MLDFLTMFAALNETDEDQEIEEQEGDEFGAISENGVPWWKSTSDTLEFRSVDYTTEEDTVNSSLMEGSLSSYLLSSFPFLGRHL